LISEVYLTLILRSMLGLSVMTLLGAVLFRIGARPGRIAGASFGKAFMAGLAASLGGMATPAIVFGCDLNPDIWLIFGMFIVLASTSLVIRLCYGTTLLSTLLLSLLGLITILASFMVMMALLFLSFPPPH